MQVFLEPRKLMPTKINESTVYLYIRIRSFSLIVNETALKKDHNDAKVDSYMSTYDLQ